jgi:type I restriction enzyme S subunit
LLDSSFLLGFLSLASTKLYIEGFNSGGSRRAITKGHIESFQIPLPPVREQRRIGVVLGTLDDKIELNRKMNRTLEDMAQALFKSWFIDFDGHVDLVESELGPIPRGWTAGRFGNVAELAYGKSLPDKLRCTGDVPVYGSGGIAGTHDESIVDGPGVIVGRKGSVGTVYWEERSFFPIDTTFFVKCADTPWLAWAFHTLQQIDIQRLGADSAVPGVNRNAILSQMCVIPPNQVVREFWDVVGVLQARKHVLFLESRTLAALRDLLLPKLISGELRVPETLDLLESSP